VVVSYLYVIFLYVGGKTWVFFWPIWEADALPLGYTRKIAKLYGKELPKIVICSFGPGIALILDKPETSSKPTPQFFRGIIP